MSLLIDVADSVVAELNLAPFSQSFTAVRLWDPRRPLKDLSALRVDVVPSQPSVETEPADRNVFQNDVSVDIAVRKKADVGNIAELDALANLVEEISEYFQGHALPVPADLITNGRFATGDLTGWTDNSSGDGSVSVAGGVCTLQTGAAGPTGQIDQAVSGLVDGTAYTLKFTVSGTDDVTVAVNADSMVVMPTDLSAGEHAIDFVMDGTEIRQLIFSNAGTTGETTEVSAVSLIRQGADRVAELQSTELLAIADAEYQHTKRVFFSALTLTLRVHTTPE